MNGGAEEAISSLQLYPRYQDFAAKRSPRPLPLPSPGRRAAGAGGSDAGGVSLWERSPRVSSSAVPAKDATRDLCWVGGCKMVFPVQSSRFFGKENSEQGKAIPYRVHRLVCRATVR